METLRTVAELRSRIAAWRGAGQTIALVPTMGSLHDGHLSLVTFAKARADRVVVSIFINPTQFAPGEDLDTYPRDEAGDKAILAPLAPNLIYAPTVREMYGPDFATRIEVGGIATGLCADSRPHFFSGVATVVAKLLNQSWPDIAVFGEKDYQQLLVIRRMARDLDIPAEILGAPTVREADGLAMSSRNAYLSVQERATAPLLHATLRSIAGGIVAGGAPCDLIGQGRNDLENAGFRVDYLELRHGETLAPLAAVGNAPARLFVAAQLGKARLIDNIAVGIGPEQGQGRRDGQ